MEDFEKLYSPSQWSKRLPASDICQSHVEVLEKESSKVRKCIPSQFNVSYGKGPREKIDILGTDLKSDSPVFIFIHGGYWQMNEITKDLQSFMAKNLYKNNIKTICVGYDLCPDVSLEQLVENIEKAVDFCLEYCKNIGHESLHFAGHSAGGHLVATIFNNYLKKSSLDDQKFFKSAFLVSGVFDLTPLIKTSLNIALKLDENSAKKLSPMLGDFYKSLTSKIYVIVGENESPSFVKQSEQFYEKLLALNVDSTYKLIQNVDHFDIIENLSIENFELTQFIIHAIKNSS